MPITQELKTFSTNQEEISAPLSATFSKTYLPLSLLVHLVAAMFFLMPSHNGVSNPFGVQRLGQTTSIEFIASDLSEARVPRSRVFRTQSVSKKTSASEDISENGEKVPSTNGSFGATNGTNEALPLGTSRGRIATAKERYVYELRMLLEARKVYPRISRQMREEGRVVVRIQVSADGHVSPVEVATASEHTRLNDAAFQLISGIKKYRPFPEELTEASLSIDVPVEYSLN